MDNYICINGNKTELTPEQLEELGLSQPDALTFADCDLADIPNILRNGNAREHFKVHDVKRVGDLDLEIIGFNHDVDDLFPDRATMTVMARQTVGTRNFNDGECKRGWIDSDLRVWLNTDFMKTLPDELIRIIRPARIYTHDASGIIHTTHDRAFIPSESELFGSAIYSGHEDGKRYEAFANREYRKRFDDDGDAGCYWTRSAYAGTAAYICYVYYSGNPSTNTAVSGYGAPVCFLLS